MKVFSSAVRSFSKSNFVISTSRRSGPQSLATFERLMTTDMRSYLGRLECQNENKSKREPIRVAITGAGGQIGSFLSNFIA